MKNIYKSKVLVTLLILLSSVAAFAQIPDPGFETWTSGNCTLYSYNDPTNWGTLNSSTCLVNAFTVQKTTTPADVHSGTSALELYSQYISFASATAPGICVTGTINTSTNAVQGGFAQTTRPDKLIGWYKYAPVAPDTFSILVNIYSGITSVTVPMGSGVVSGSNTVSAYTKFIANINYNSGQPADSAQITLLCSAGANGQSGTKMFIDDLAFVSCAGFTAAPSTVNATCATANGSITLATPVNGTAPYTYNWSNSSTANSISGLTAGTYKVTITDNNTCTALDSVVVGSTNVPFTVNVTGGTTSCSSNTGTVSATASAGNSPYTYLWSNQSTATQITGLGAGNYTVVVTDVHGCTTSATGAVTTPSGPTATDSVTNLTCFNDNSGQILVTVSGGATPLIYAWSNSGTSASLTNLGAGSYTLTITDHNNCSFSVSATVTQPAILTATGTSTNAVCHGDSVGTVSVSVNGGVIPYNYSWTGATGSTNNISNLPAGTYVVAITDSNLCTVKDTLTITQPSAISVTVSTTNASSANGSDGTAMAAASGGTGSLHFVWNTSSTHDTITHLSPATYCVTATDAHNCTANACDSVGYSVGINAITSALVKIYPNPASSQLTIETNSTDGKFLFMIYSLDGRLVDQRAITGEVNMIQLAHLADGFYTYQLKDIFSGNLNYGKLQIQR